jgi:putative DNA primase/helicase
MESIVAAIGLEPRDLFSGNGATPCSTIPEKPCPPASPVEIVGPVTSAQIAALKRSNRIADGQTLERVGAKEVRWNGAQWLGIPTLESTWKLWALNSNGVPRLDAKGKLERRNVGAVSLVISPALREGPKSDALRLWDVEGESDWIACIDAGIEHVIATTGGAGTSVGHVKHADWLAEIKPAEVVVVRDLDDPGREGAEKVCDWWRSQGVAVRILSLPESLGKGGDLRDFLNGRCERDGQPAVEPLGNATALNELAIGSELLLPIEQESETCDTDAKLNELARLPRIEYDQRREEEAKALGIRVTTLDAEVAERRPESSEKASTGTTVIFAEVEPWPHPVDGEELLHNLTAGYQRFLALTEWSAEAMALWTVHAHAHDLSQISPFLAFTSPEKRCGKTTALGLLRLTCPQPLPASNITGPALFRSIEKWRPTMLVDEADTFLKDSDELRGIFNSGHNRSQAVVIRTAGDDHEPMAYSTWSPKVIAMIGSLPSTLEDRAIAIPMRRRRSDEKVEKFRADRNYGMGDLARQCARWVQDNSDDLREIDPGMPKALHDRASDNWRALIAIADVAGGDWPALARKAAESLTPTEDESSIGTLLLADIREILIDRGNPERISSTDLCEALLALPDRPWPEITRGRPLNTNTLSRRLKPFEIRSKQRRIGDANVKGYAREDFTEAFERYILTDFEDTPDQTETSKQVSEINELEHDQTETEPAECFGLKSPNSLELKGCFDVSDGEPVSGGELVDEGVI